MTEINNKLLCLFEGRCPHEFSIVVVKDDHTYDWRKCAICGASEGDMPPDWHYPDYSNPADRERLLQYLMGQGEMWKTFRRYSFNEWLKEDDINYSEYEARSESWLYLPPPNSDIPRWLYLLQEWLQLEETVDRFGWKGCPEWGDCTVTVIKYGCDKCDGTGKVLTEWAKDKDNRK